VEQLHSQVINNDVSLHNKEKEILELQKVVTDQRQHFLSALFILKSRIEDWMRLYVVSASLSGEISFVGFLQQNQYISPGQQLFYIQPASNKFYGELQMGQIGFGKLKLGQRVIVRLSSYPSNEFGYLGGIITYIPTLMASDTDVLVRVDFPDGLRTNFGKQLVFRSNMTASAEVVTDSRRLPTRIFGQVRDMLKK
jgi:hypothetical protein